ncbi:PLP-dependent cysteine synthase family protein [Burkholderia cepacia]|uniref:PLP-dependent cysteine synthase family protein n=1 Tax=Burkholderia cepacia TaxID=292 RepID=UPI001ABB9B3A|nr:cysteine synthase family protein [Burkholderia cepacia]
MKSTPGNILDTIGNTSLVPLRNVVPKNGARLFVKLESQNPTGSMKDRIALEMIEAPERDGRLKPGGAVVEYTGGSTGVSLALVCAVKRHPLHLVSSDAFSKEKLDHMRLLGAKLTLVASDNGKQTEKLTKDMIREAHRIAGETGAYITAQMENTDQLNAYTKMADEIWEQTGGRLDGFVQSVGTAASLRGISRRLREHDARIRIAGVEPAESAVLSGGPTGAHKIDGIGAGYVVPLWRDGIADELERVSTEEARAMAFRLAAEEGLFCGTSTGANVTGALRLAERLGRRRGIVLRYVDRSQRNWRIATRRTAWPGRHDRDDHVRHRHEVPEVVRANDGLTAIGRSRIVLHRDRFRLAQQVNGDQRDRHGRHDADDPVAGMAPCGREGLGFTHVRFTHG